MIKYNLLPPGTPGSSYREAATIFKLASQLKPPVRTPISCFCCRFSPKRQVQTVSLAHNNIRSGKDLSSLGHYLPKIVNLSLADNQISTMEDVMYLANKKGKLDTLRELVMTGNPIKGTDSTNTEQYRRRVLRFIYAYVLITLVEI